MSAFERALAGGEINLAEFADAPGIDELAAYIWSEENDGDDFARARLAARSFANGRGCALSTLYRVVHIAENAGMSLPGGWLERLAFAEGIIDVMSRSIR